MSKQELKDKPYNLEKRTLMFAQDVLSLCRRLNKNILNSALIHQLIRSSSSVGANYREANDSLGKKDFLLRLKPKICAGNETASISPAQKDAYASQGLTPTSMFKSRRDLNSRPCGRILLWYLYCKIRVKISRREAKESHHWLDLIAVANEDIKNETSPLLTEALELKSILSAIIKKFE